MNERREFCERISGQNSKHVQQIYSYSTLYSCIVLESVNESITGTSNFKVLKHNGSQFVLQQLSHVCHSLQCFQVFCLISNVRQSVTNTFCLKYKSLMVIMIVSNVLFLRAPLKSLPIKAESVQAIELNKLPRSNGNPCC